MIIQKEANNIILHQLEDQICPYIEILLDPHIKYIEPELIITLSLQKRKLHVLMNNLLILMTNYILSILIVLVPSNITMLEFFCAHLWEKVDNFSFRINFPNAKNVSKLEALLLGLENVLKLGCIQLMVFNNSKLVMDMVKNIYSPINKILKQRYT